MDVRPPHPEPQGATDDGTGVGPDRGSTTGAPRWVKVFGVAFIAALIVAFVLMHTIGGGMGGH
ncbi:hypothetical protein [Streptomyces sp. 8N616]|uniref:hypothetical protein n=1 Tax=Streptomyces sp. 8N616 TaxID=3457414 RepID=UPI003FD127FB